VITFLLLRRSAQNADYINFASVMQSSFHLLQKINHAFDGSLMVLLEGYVCAYVK